MQITKVEVQKKNKYRYSLYSDDVFLFGVSENTLIKFAISKNKKYSDDELKEIQAYEQVSQCLEQSYRFLRRRSHLKNELRTKLRQKKYADDEIEQTIKILRQKKYLDDLVYIKQFVKDAVNIKNNQKNLGTIQSSNLCHEICEYTSRDEIAVCNLASIALSSFVWYPPCYFEETPTLYSTENCKWCNKMKTLLKTYNIEYNEVMSRHHSKFHSDRIYL